MTENSSFGTYMMLVSIFTTIFICWFFVAFGTKIYDMIFRDEMDIVFRKYYAEDILEDCHFMFRCFLMFIFYLMMEGGFMGFFGMAGLAIMD